ncbi:MAG: ATP-binding protein [Anaerolineales bacterium]
MRKESSTSSTLHPQELEVVYEISSTVAGVENTDSALEEIIQLARQVFIFDNIVIYRPSHDSQLEPVHPKAIGRGRFLEADLVWGESVAQKAYTEEKTILYVEDLTDSIPDRTGIRHYLGFPLIIMGVDIIGSLVFIRFGGPPYTESQVRLAKYFSENVARLLEHQNLVNKVASLEAKHRLEILQDDFTSTISHELLTPLGYIKGYTTTLLRNDVSWSESERLEFLQIISDESDRLALLIESFMDASHLQTGTFDMTFQPVKIEILIQEAIQRARARDETLKINLNQTVTDIEIPADPIRLVQVFDNIFNNNSKHATNSLVSIAVGTTNEPLVHITITDEGPGIHPDHLEQIFDRFYRIPSQSNNSIPGAGLGLFICRKIIEAHNGRIYAQSEIGAGTTIHIFLPYEQPTQ